MKYTIIYKPMKPRFEFPYFARGTGSGRLALMLDRQRYIYLDGDVSHIHGAGKVIERVWSNAEFSTIYGTITFTQE